MRDAAEDAETFAVKFPPKHAQRADAVRVKYEAPNGGERWVWAFRDGDVWRKTE